MSDRLVFNAQQSSFDYCQVSLTNPNILKFNLLFIEQREYHWICKDYKLMCVKYFP